MRVILLLITSIICLSCNEAPSSFVNDQYSIKLVFEMIDGVPQVSKEKSVCHKRKYSFTRDAIKALEDFKEVPLSECSLMIGYKPKAYAEQWAFFDFIRSEIAESQRLYLSNEAGYQH